MKYNKQSAFTLAEVLVLLLTITILIAAFAPVFTKRYTNQSASIWKYVPGDENQDVYFDSFNRSEAAQAFVGLSPLEGADVPLFLNYNDSDDLIEVEPVYSKLVIHASDNLAGYSDKPQHQFQFRYVTKDSTSSTGDIVASLFAGNGNIMLGGPFKYLKTSAKDNTVYGAQTLTKDQFTTGYNNTVYGALAGYRLTNGYDNTLVGSNTGELMRVQAANTLVGSYTGYQLGIANPLNPADYNTLLGGYSGPTVQTGRYLSSSYNTVVGLGAMSGCHSSETDTNGVLKCTGYNANTSGYNTAVGNNSLALSSGKGNTALGYSALLNLKGGNYNTAIGYTSCSFLGKDEGGKALNKITCIGANSGPELGTESTNDLAADVGHVFIGGKPKDYKTNSKGTAPRAVLEVHNTDKVVKVGDSSSGINNLPSPSGHESVVVNGNLIVRGQTYLEAQMIRPYIDYRNALRTPKALTLFRLTPAYYQTTNSGVMVFSGFDGIDRSVRTLRTCRGDNKERKFDAAAPNCICTVVGDSYTDNTSYHKGFSTTFSKKVDTTLNYDAKPSYSYDWNTKANLPSSYFYSYYMNSKSIYYVDQATGYNVFLAEHSDGFPGSGTNLVDNYVDLSYSHGLNPYPGASEFFTCCPNLTSDIRLKNVGEKFVAGLDEIRKINVYNFTFKTDKNRVPQVGVIAQDLKRVFPNAVSKDEKGYYQIRWDEMLYAAINAIKTLNSKVEKLADKIATDKERIANLKADNAKMYAQLDKLAEELDQLEAKSRK